MALSIIISVTSLDFIRNEVGQLESFTDLFPATLFELHHR
jgi:hypothetical protein